MQWRQTKRHSNLEKSKKVNGYTCDNNMSKVRMNMWLAKCHSSKFWSTLKYNQFRRVHHSNFGTFPSHKKCHAQPSNIKQSKYIQVHLTRKTLRKKPLNQTIESTEAPPQKFKWFFVNEKLSHISSQLDQLLNSSVGTVFISTVSTLRQGVHVFGFIMAVIIVGGKRDPTVWDLEVPSFRSFC